MINMDIQKKHRLSGAIIIVSCFLLLAGACEKSDGIETGAQTRNVFLSFNASTTNSTVTETRSVESINGFTGNSYTFGMSITKNNSLHSEVFEGSGDLTATMSNPPQIPGGEWSWSFKKNTDNQLVTPQGPEGKPLKVIAYYPAISGTGAFTNGIPFDFSGTTNPKQTEILYNTNTSYIISSSSGEDKATIPLQFQHAYSWIVINVTKYIAKGTFNLTSVAIDNLSGEWIKNKGNISPETGLAMEGSSTGPIGEVRSPQALSVGSPITYEFLVPAFMDAGVKDEDIVITMMINGNKELFPIKKEHLNKDGNTYGFRQGYKNTYNLEYNNSSMNLRLLDWTSADINENFGGNQSVPANYVKIDYQSYDGSGRPPLWTSADNNVKFPQMYTASTIGNHLFESYLTTVNYGANGAYVPANPVISPPPAGGIIIDDDQNVASMEKVYPIFQMTTEDISIEPVPWEDDNGDLVAKEICRKYNGGGFHNWRLPRASELRALFVYLIYNAGHNTSLSKLNFSADKNQYKLYWTGTEVNENQAWAMYYYDESRTNFQRRGPMISPQDKKMKLVVRCIREIP